MEMLWFRVQELVFRVFRPFLNDPNSWSKMPRRARKILSVDEIERGA